MSHPESPRLEAEDGAKVCDCAIAAVGDEEDRWVLTPADAAAACTRLALAVGAASGGVPVYAGASPSRGGVLAPLTVGGARTPPTKKTQPAMEAGVFFQLIRSSNNFA